MKRRDFLIGTVGALVIAATPTIAEAKQRWVKPKLRDGYLMTLGGNILIMPARFRAQPLPRDFYFVFTTSGRLVLGSANWAYLREHYGITSTDVLLEVHRQSGLHGGSENDNVIQLWRENEA